MPYSLFPDGTLSGKRVVITGAARGLGRTLALVLSDLGAELILAARNKTRLTETADLLERRSGRRPALYGLDLADPQAVVGTCEEILSAHGSIDILINNGALWLPGSIEETGVAEIVIAINSAVTGSVLMTKGLLPGLERSGAGDVVTIVSTSGLPRAQRQEASAAFHAAKYGQAGFSDLLRQEVRGRGIRVMALYPPDFDDVVPGEPEWDATPARAAGETMTAREVTEGVLFALTRPRACTVDSIVFGNTREG